MIDILLKVGKNKFITKDAYDHMVMVKQIQTVKGLLEEKIPKPNIPPPQAKKL